MSKIIPTILTGKEDIYREKLNILENLTDRIQIDLMDGEFVVEKSIALDIVQKYPSKQAILEAHLMVADPLPWIDKLPDFFKFASVHFETKDFFDNWPILVEKGLNKGIKLGIALNPETKVDVVAKINPAPESVLVLGVHPGRSGQAMLEGTKQKLQNLNKIYFGAIGIDGGINISNIALIAEDAELIYTGNSLFSSNKPQINWKALNNQLNKI